MNNKEGITKRRTEKKKERTPTEDSLSLFPSLPPPSLSFLSPSQLSQRLSLPDDLLSKRWHEHTVSHPQLLEYFFFLLHPPLCHSFCIFLYFLFSLHGLSSEAEEEVSEVDRG